MSPKRELQSGGPSPAPIRTARWLGIALLIIVLDQATKLVFEHQLDYGQRIPVLPFFDFTLLYNRGAAFSFLAGQDGWQRWLFTAIALIASAVIVWLLRRHPRETLFCASLTLIMGGAIGNVIDRVVYGHVVDFLLFHWHPWYFPAFNLADTAITLGAVLLIVDELRKARRARAHRESA